jgi:hypothetical protein
MLLGLHASGVDWKAGACFTVIIVIGTLLYGMLNACNFMHYIYNTFRGISSKK